MILYQLGMEWKYCAFLVAEWAERDMTCDIRIRKAKAAGLVVVEITDKSLAEEMCKRVRCRMVEKWI